MNNSKLFEMENSSEDETENSRVFDKSSRKPQVSSQSVSLSSKTNRDIPFSLPPAQSLFGFSPANSLPSSSSAEIFLNKVKHKGRKTLVRDFHENEESDDEEQQILVEEQIKKLMQEKERNSLSVIHRSDLLTVENRYETKKQETENFLYYECYKAQNFDTNGKGICLILHGLHEHCQRYKNACELFARHGYLVFALDLHGHGKSSGLSGYVRKFDVWIEQTDEFIQKCILQQKSRQRPANIDKLRCAASTLAQVGIGVLKNKDIQQVIFDPLVNNFKKQKFFILGQGIGATIAFFLSQRYHCPTILSAPLLLLPQERHSILQKLAAAIATISPKAEVVDINLEKRCHSEYEIIAFKNDPYCRNAKLRARVGYELIRICKFLTSKLENSPFPMFILHGGQDYSCDVRGSITLHEVSNSKDKTLKIYDTLWHDLLHEDRQGSILQEIVDWMNARQHILKETCSYSILAADEEFYSYSHDKDSRSEIVQMHEKI